MGVSPAIGGHVSLIESTEGKNVVLLEPEKSLPRRRTVNISDLIVSMNYHGQLNSGGFWVFSAAKL
ncbi:MAG: hypothetical protein ACP5E4_02425, partial [Candidatus Aenigmatarchaeota archaeon]